MRFLCGPPGSHFGSARDVLRLVCPGILCIWPGRIKFRSVSHSLPLIFSQTASPRRKCTKIWRSPVRVETISVIWAACIVDALRNPIANTFSSELIDASTHHANRVITVKRTNKRVIIGGMNVTVGDQRSQWSFRKRRETRVSSNGSAYGNNVGFHSFSRVSRKISTESSIAMSLVTECNR